ncbi:retrotransposon protein, putative, ty1-copia subclass [Tanacetum coccineum]
MKKKKLSQGASTSDGIYEIDLHDSSTNDSFMYVVSNKIAKLKLDSTLLWHCRLGHISKKRIEKLQHDGLLKSTDLESFDKCVSCMSGKMARKPYSHQVERAKDLLGLIHTDVCGPFRTMSRQGTSYFVTFTDEFSRYGYVYLLKHKHEVLETFKMFQKEVENQLGKTIKLLRSNHGGEYMSQEFLDHLKDHDIISHRTPLYTPQHNGVSERRNRTLLDMVRSMISQITLPMSFWDYACKSATRILNMVPTKKALVKRDTLTKPDKLEPISIKCIFIGYPKETMGYSFYYPPKNKVLVARNVEFFKNSLITQEARRSLEDLEIIQDEDMHPSENTSLHHDKYDQEIDEPQSDIIPVYSRKVSYVLGIKICKDRSRRSIGLCQSAYIKKILNRINMENSKRGSIPMQDKPKLSKSQGALTPDEVKRMQRGPYASALGSIMYVNILKYLRNTKDMFLFYGGDIKRELKVACYTDVGYLTDVDDSKSQTGYVFILNGGAIDSKSTEQSILATSSAEAEYIAALDASKEAV